MKIRREKRPVCEKPATTTVHFAILRESKKKQGAYQGSSPPLSILLDVSSNILPPEEQTIFQPAELISAPDIYNLTSQMFNCTSNMNNCTVIIGGQICQVFNSSKNSKNQSASRGILMRQRQISFNNDATDFQGNKVFILCPENQAGQANKGSTFLIYITFVGTSLSIISHKSVNHFAAFTCLSKSSEICLANVSSASLWRCCVINQFFSVLQSQQK